MKKRLMLIVVLIVYTANSFAQVKKPDVQSRANPFEMVHCGINVENELYRFIWEERGDTVNAGIWIHHLLQEDKASNYRFVDGIYSFRLMGPTSRFYYFIHSKTETINIIKNYAVENVLSEVIKYFNEKGESLSEKKKLEYVGLIIEDLKTRDVDGDYEILTKPKVFKQKDLPGRMQAN